MHMRADARDVKYFMSEQSVNAAPGCTISSFFFLTLYFWMHVHVSAVLTKTLVLNWKYM